MPFPGDVLADAVESAHSQFAGTRQRLPLNPPDGFRIVDRVGALVWRSSSTILKREQVARETAANLKSKRICSFEGEARRVGYGDG
jgi:hypothetical protein